MSNVLAVFGDIHSERLKNLLQDLTSASVSQAGARLWTIEYRDFKAERELAFRFALVSIKPSGGNTGDSASELRAIDKRLQDDKGRGDKQSDNRSKLGKALPLVKAGKHQAGRKTKMT